MENRILKVLILCEESQTVCKAFRELGHLAFSNDIQKCSGGHPEWHINLDSEIVMHGNCNFITEFGTICFIDYWDIIIAHPPCTFMSKAGARWMYPTAGNLDLYRLNKAIEAKGFFDRIFDLDVKHLCIENPVPLKIVGLPNHTQSIQPFEHGHEFSKKTLLWLKGLPNLIPTDVKKEYKPYLPSNTGGKKRGQKFMFKNISQKESSKTFEGIAQAMAEQWSNYVLNIT